MDENKVRELIRQEFDRNYYSGNPRIPPHTHNGVDNLPISSGGSFAVGGIYISITGNNPSTELGYGTWAAFGTGQVLVGIDTTQTEFNTVLKTGGEKTHTLITSEIPSHSHVEITNGSNNSGSGPSGLGQNTGPISSGINTGSTGGDGAHNNLQPYIVVYMWKRTS